MWIGDKEFLEDQTYVMGILNVTPDSFSDGGRCNSLDAALRQTERMISEGAAIIDIGGESTRPGYTKISDEEETERVLPVIEAIKARFDIPVSLDTYKGKVAEAGFAAGIDLLNDIWGLKYDDRMAGLIAKYGAACCLMHNRKEPDYKDFVIDWCEDLRGTLDLAKAAGIPDEKIILDPGVGFGKSYQQNLMAIRYLDELHQLGYPLLLGTSRKSVIGLTLEVPVDERVIGTAVTTVFAVLKACMFVRVHDVKENVQAIQMAQAILRG